MAIQELKTWCDEIVVDGVTNTANRRNLTDEEFLNGWVRLATVSMQQMNSLFHTTTQYAKASPFSPELIPASASVPSIALEWVDGGAISQSDSPELYAFYGSTFPTLQSTAPSGWKYIVRNN